MGPPYGRASVGRRAPRRGSAPGERGGLIKHAYRCDPCRPQGLLHSLFVPSGQLAPLCARTRNPGDLPGGKTSGAGDQGAGGRLPCWSVKILRGIFSGPTYGPPSRRVLTAECQ